MRLLPAPRKLNRALREIGGAGAPLNFHHETQKHTPEEFIKELREAATLLAGGQSGEEVCKKLEVNPPTCHRWRQEYGGAKEETVKRLNELEKENGGLKRLVAEVSLDKAILKEVAEGKW